MQEYLVRIYTRTDSHIYPYITCDNEEEAEMIAIRRFIMDYNVHATFSIDHILVEEL
jgi:hypothetical protein